MTDEELRDGVTGRTKPDAPGTDAAIEGEVGDSTLVPPWDQGHADPADQDPEADADR